ncbi:MAG: N-6 DNA methylase [Verrucomicrobia bacterium]|nr:N-6 DNA methylase [Verrucomicrobiota bacterium]
MKTVRQKLPPSGPAREALRQKGQFWTPDWVAQGMVAYVVDGDCREVFDPAVGAGAFFRAVKQIAKEAGRSIRLHGTEIDPAALEQAVHNELSAVDLAGVQIRDFVLNPPSGPLPAIVANPPYIRHHRLGSEVKAKLRTFAVKLIGRPLDGRAGIHVYFLLRALQLLKREGRLAFIMSADTCEGVFAPTLWNWITRSYCLDAILTFAPEASPFPGVDTNAIVFMIRNAKPASHFLWAKCNAARCDGFKQWALAGFKGRSSEVLTIYRRSVAEGLATGFSREPGTIDANAPRLGDFAKVLRGIATGFNEFFFLTRSQAASLRIPNEFLIPAVGRTRDVAGEEISSKTLDALDAAGRPTLLFSPDGRDLDAFPKAVREYLRYGEEIGLPKRPLIASRQPWYKMETRQPPPFLFAYLGRRNARFIRNRAGILPLTGFLCVYPRSNEPEFVDRLGEALRHPDTIANLRLVGKSYGQGCIKVEPRALERLPLASAVTMESEIETFSYALPLEFIGSETPEPALLVRERHGKRYVARQKSGGRRKKRAAN